MADARLLGVALPFIQDGERTEYATTLACAERWRAALPGTGLAEKLAATRENQRRCMVAMMFHFCWVDMDARADSYRRRGVVDFTARRIGEKFKVTADAFHGRECDGILLTDEQRFWWAALTHAFMSPRNSQ